MGFSIVGADGQACPQQSSRRRGDTGKRGKGAEPKAFEEEQEKTPAQRRTAMTRAQRLKRVFGIDIETCPACGGVLRIIACIEDPAVIKKILANLDRKNACTTATTNRCKKP